MRGWRWQAHRAWRWLDYRVRLTLLEVLGPATLDWEHDPIEQLKRSRQAELQRQRTVWIAR